MKGNGKRILSIFLAGVIAVTTVGYAPPFTASASWKTNMEKALELLASPSEASKQESTATPSEAENPGREATPSEAEIPDGKATPSQAVKKFVRVEPEEIPEYYSQVSASGKKFWKFEDRNGMMQYRDYGYLQEDAEFPLWYVANLTGVVDDTFESVNLDEEYYSEAPYIYKSVAPDQTAWTNLSWRLFSNNEEINDYTKKKISGFKNWDFSEYYIWHLANRGEEEDEVDLGYHFYGIVINEEEGEGQPGWFYSDENGIINNMKNQLMASLAASDAKQFEILQYYQWPTLNQPWDNYKKNKVGDYTNGYLGSTYNSNPSKWNYPENLKTFTLDTLSYPGYTFLGWCNAQATNPNYSTGPDRPEGAWTNPEKYPYVYGYVPDHNPTQLQTTLVDNNIFTSGHALYPGGLTAEVRSFLTSNASCRFYAMWVPENSPYLILINDVQNIKNYWVLRDANNKFNPLESYSSILGEDVPIFRNISVKPYGTEIDTSYLTKTDPYKKGYKFAGYFTGLDGTGEKLSKTYTYTKTDDRYYAYWIPEEKAISVTFKDWDGSVLENQTISIGANAMPPQPPKRSGYTFIGWDRQLNNIQGDVEITALYDSSKYTVTFIDFNNEILKTETGEYGFDATAPTDPVRTGYHFRGWNGLYKNIRSDLTIKAQYEPILYWFYYYGNDETSGNMAFSIVEYDETRKLTINTFKKVGYKFISWNTKQDGTGDNYSDEQVIHNVTPVAGTVINLYAQWEKNTIEVVYKDWNGDILKTQEVGIGADATPPSDPERSGYTFTGWDKPSTNIQNHTTITAQYTANIFTLDGNGGTLAGDETKSQMISFGESIDQVLTDGAAKASRKYYTFDGWYTMPTGGSKYTGSGNTMPASSVSVYAHWVQSSSEVVYKDWNGNVLKTQEVALGEDATPPSDPVRAGYTFTGWDKPSTNIQNHTTITAQYTANSFTLTLDGNGGTLAGDETKSQMISFGESIDQVLTNGAVKANRKYHTFDGWYTAPTGGSKYTGSGNTMPASSVTVYAHWTHISSEVVYKDWNGNVIKIQEVAIGADATPPSNPVRAGYTFTGWDKPSTNIQNHTTITAQYTANSFTLTLDGNGGTLTGDETKSQMLSCGESIDQVLTDGAAKASQKYHTFDGWYTEPTGGSKYTGSGNTMPASSVTVYAHWTRISSEVVYRDWNGDVLKTQEVALGEDVTPPSDPVRAGYTFTGWDKPSTKIQNHTTITAQYTANQFTLTLDGNGGTLAGNETKSQMISFGESMDQVLTDEAAKASQKYHTFDGWYTAPTGGSKYTGSGNTMPASSVTVYAHWTHISSEVVYKDWNGNVIKIQEVAIGADATPPEDPVRAGYAFTGWDKPSTNIQNHTIITAQYTANSFTLTLDGNGGTLAGDETKSQMISIGESIDQVLSDGAAKANGKYHTFDGWYTAPTGGSKYTGSGYTMPSSSMTVYAHWTRISSEVVYKDWDGNVIKTQEVAIGDDATPPSEPVRVGYAFTGWDKPSTNIQNHTTITAQYTANSFTLTLDGNGGTLAGDETKSQMIFFGESIDQVLSDGAVKANRKYHTFGGWYTAPTGGSKYTGSGYTMPSSSVTVYAHWTRISSEVVYKDWNGNVIKTQVVAIGDDATRPSEPVRVGYAFTGWDKSSTNIQDHTTITAQYTANSFTLTLDGKGGTLAGDETKSQMISFGESIDQVISDGAVKANRKYHTFDGWYTAPTGGSKYTGSGYTMPSSSVTVYAHWTRISSEVIYKDWNGNVIKIQEVVIGADAMPPSNPVRAGYTFTGWDKSSTNIQSHTTITAIYSVSNYKQQTEENSKVVPTLAPPTIDTTTRPAVPDNGGKFIVNPENPFDVTYTKPDGTTSKDEWVGDGKDWYHVDEEGKINYDWFLEGEKTWYKLNQEKGNRFGAALIGWNHEPMDNKRYFFDPTSTKMLTGWQNIDGKSYYFTTRNEGQTYFGNNRQGSSNNDGWKYDSNRPGKPYGSMYLNEYTPDGYWVDENGVCADKK